MLNLGFDFDINVKKTRSPISFGRKNICVHCGAVGSLTFVDKWGHNTNKEINAYDHIKCRNCGRIYSISWEPEDGSDKLYPYPVDYNIGSQFNNFCHKGDIRDNGHNSLD